MVALSGGVSGCQFQSEASDPLCAEARTRAVRCLVHGRSSGGLEHADGGLEAQRDGDLVRSADPVAGAGDDDRAFGADRDRIDDVRAALSDRAALRVIGPYQRRARRVEPGDDLEPGRGAQFRADRTHGARRTLSPGARVLRRRDRAVGQLGRGRVCARCRDRTLFRSRPAARARSPGGIPVGARPLEHRAAGAGLAGHRAGRGIRCRTAARRRDRRDDLFSRRRRAHGRQGYTPT